MHKIIQIQKPLNISKSLIDQRNHKSIRLLMSQLLIKVQESWVRSKIYSKVLQKLLQKYKQLEQLLQSI